MADNKRTFEVDGKEYAVVRPNTRQNEDATMEYNRVFSRSLQNGALLRERLDQFMRQQNLWDDERERQTAPDSSCLFNRGRKKSTVDRHRDFVWPGSIKKEKGRWVRVYSAIASLR